MLNQAVLVGRVVDIVPYNDNQWVHAVIEWDDNSETLPIDIKHNQMADSFMKLVEVGTMVGIKGIIVHEYDNSRQSWGLNFKVQKFSVLEEVKGQ